MKKSKEIINVDDEKDRKTFEEEAKVTSKVLSVQELVIRDDLMENAAIREMVINFPVPSARDYIGDKLKKQPGGFDELKELILEIVKTEKMTKLMDDAQEGLEIIDIEKVFNFDNYKDATMYGEYLELDDQPTQDDFKQNYLGDDECIVDTDLLFQHFGVRFDQNLKFHFAMPLFTKFDLAEEHYPATQQKCCSWITLFDSFKEQVVFKDVFGIIMNFKIV